MGLFIARRQAAAAERAGETGGEREEGEREDAHSLAKQLGKVCPRRPGSLHATRVLQRTPTLFTDSQSSVLPVQIPAFVRSGHTDSIGVCDRSFDLTGRRRLL